MLPVHCETSAIEGEGVTPSEDIREIETRISELLNNTRGLSSKQKQSVARRLKELSEQYSIDLMAAYPTGSIVVYFLCQTFRSIVVLKGMIDSGQMQNILEDIFKCILKKDSIRLKLNVSLDLEEYQKRIQEARTTSKIIKSWYAWTDPCSGTQFGLIHDIPMKRLLFLNISSTCVAQGCPLNFIQNAIWILGTFDGWTSCYQRSSIFIWNYFCCQLPIPIQFPILWIYPSEMINITHPPSDLLQCVTFVHVMALDCSEAFDTVQTLLFTLFDILCRA